MGFILRVITSIGIGLFAYLFLLCNQKGGERSFWLLFTDSQKFFNTFDPMSSHFEIVFKAGFGIIIGLCVFIFWPE